jgi:hypothetical protein
MVRIITFKTNHSIIGDVTDNGMDIFVKEPLQIVVQPTQDGSSMMAFVPFIEFSEEFKKGIKFSFGDILTINTPVTELLNQYNKIFGAGIEIVSSMDAIKRVK